MGNAPSASYSLTMRVQIANKPGMLGKVTSAIGEAGGDIGAIDLVEAGSQFITRDISCNASDEGHGQRITAAVKTVDGVTVKNVSDRTFLMHLGGKIEVNGKVSVKTRDDLSMAYTPGVARVCMAIHHDPEKAYTLTIKGNTVAVVTDGTAVLGLGALTNALDVVKRKLEDVTIVFTGAGASGIATAKLLMKAGAKHIIGCDRAGTIYKGRTENMNSMKQWFAENTNAKGLK